MQVFIKGPEGKTITLDIDKSDTINKLKENYFNKTKTYKPGQQRYIFQGRELIDSNTISNSKIKKESTIHMVYKQIPFEEKLPPIDFFGKNINNFINTITSVDDDHKKIITVIPGSKIGSDRKMKEPFIKEGSHFSYFHDVFRQQLPLPILFNAYQENKDIHIFLFDPAFSMDIFDFLDIRSILSKIDSGMNYGTIDIYTSYITDIFKEIKISGFDYSIKSLLLNLYVIPFSYNINKLMELSNELNSEYYIYLKNPHQSLTEESLITNSQYKNELIKWHSIELSGGNLPKHYTSKLSRKDKKKQIKAIKKSKEAYRKGNYISRPKFKSFKSKKSSWTEKFEKKIGKNIKTYKQISNKTGIPVGALKAVVKKGMGAYYSSGSRPNQTAESWGKARMYSYIMGGPTRKIDNHITKEFNVKFKK